MYSNMIFRSLLVLFILCLFLHLVTSRSTLNDKLGPATTIIYNNYTTCRGPKLANLTKYTTILEGDEKGYLVTLNMTFLEDIVVDEMRIVIYSKEQKVKTVLWNYKLEDPCKNFGFVVLLKALTNSTSCIVKQGTYYARVSVADFYEKIVGMASSFLYGTYKSKTLVLSKKGNILCLISDITFKKN